MTTYTPIKHPPTMEAWLEKNNLPLSYLDVFEWSNERLISMYNRCFDLIAMMDVSELHMQAHGDALRSLRRQYVKDHGIDCWSQLCPKKDADQLVWHQRVRTAIAENWTQLRAMRVEGRRLDAEIRLIEGVFTGVYTGYDAILRDLARSTRGDYLIRFSRIARDATDLGPLHNKEYMVAPRRDWALPNITGR